MKENCPHCGRFMPRPRASQISEEADAELARYMAGDREVTLSSIRRKYGHCERSLRRRLIELGGAPRRRGAPRVSIEDRTSVGVIAARAWRDARGERTMKEVAAVYGVSMQLISNLAARMRDEATERINAMLADVAKLPDVIRTFARSAQNGALAGHLVGAVMPGGEAGTWLRDVATAADVAEGRSQILEAMKALRPGPRGPGEEKVTKLPPAMLSVLSLVINGAPMRREHRGQLRKLENLCLVQHTSIGWQPLPAGYDALQDSAR